jgi:small subunit ribosomal protein S20
MPHTSSAKKRLRQNEKQRLRNRMMKKALKTQIKKVQQAAATGTAEELQVEFRAAAMKLDKAAVKHVIHKNLAARKKSQLASLVNAKKEKASPAGQKT